MSVLKLTLTCPAALPSHAPVAQKSAELRRVITCVIRGLFVRADLTERLRYGSSTTMTHLRLWLICQRLSQLIWEIPKALVTALKLSWSHHFHQQTRVRKKLPSFFSFVNTIIFKIEHFFHISLSKRSFLRLFSLDGLKLVFSKDGHQKSERGQWNPNMKKKSTFSPWKRRKTTSSAFLCATSAWGLRNFFSVEFEFFVLRAFYVEIFIWIAKVTLKWHNLHHFFFK